MPASRMPRRKPRGYARAASRISYGFVLMTKPVQLRFKAMLGIEHD